MMDLHRPTNPLDLFSTKGLVESITGASSGALRFHLTPPPRQPNFHAFNPQLPKSQPLLSLMIMGSVQTL
ncbi:hypothetical protein K432DRAFT_384365 [Lepidopterella palustris CBS 459.81]|uniref:Uncharacterized protein n=1 Tax=Lepidopterella palustris CBS 459.81 TaxID=1314670 RepID=A0A8E2E5Z2_9PEZI|nr:hypothetical protein K432DRAFT_384365 [Lepidopterella palustris CBS 459.81]